MPGSAPAGLRKEGKTLRKVLLLLCGVLLVGGIWLAPPAQAQPFTFPKINNKGQAVWAGKDGADTETFLYRGFGNPINISQDLTNNRRQQINDRGKVVWAGNDVTGDLEIFLYYGWGKPKQLTNNSFDDISPKINNSNQVVWYGDSDGDNEIFLYNLSRKTTTQISHNNYDDTYPALNDKGQVAWHAENTNTNEDEIWLYKKTFFGARTKLLFSAPF